MAEMGEIMRAVAHYSLPAGSQALNVFHFQTVVSGLSDEDWVAAATAWFANSWIPRWRVNASSQCRFDGIEYDVIKPNNEVVRNLGTAVINLSGMIGDQGMPPAVSWYLQTYTGNPKVRGRKYVPGFGEDSYANGRLTPNALAQLLILASKVLEPLTSGGNQVALPVVVSRVLETALPLLESVYVTDIPAYQRRRKPNVGS